MIAAGPSGTPVRERALYIRNGAPYTVGTHRHPSRQGVSLHASSQVMTACRTVALLGRGTMRAQQIVRISLMLSGGSSRLTSRIARRVGTGSGQCFSTFGGGMKLATPSASKR